MWDAADTVTVREAMRRLSPVRQRVWRLLAEGRTQTEIAAELGVVQGTVSRHVAAIRRLLGDVGFDDWARRHDRRTRRRRRREGLFST